MRVFELIEELKKFPPNAVVHADGWDMEGTQHHKGELNVVEKQGKYVYLTHYQIGISYNGGKTWLSC